MTQPYFLLLALPIAAALLFAVRRSLAGMTPAQRRTCLAVRALLLLSLLAAVVGLHAHWRRDDVSVVFAIDDSASISAAAKQQARAFVEKSVAARRSGDDVGVIGFAEEPRVWQSLAPSSKLMPKWPATVNREATHASRALDFASALLPAGKARRVVLLSDGADTGGSADETAARLGAAGIELSIVPLRNPFAPEALISSLEAPRGLKAGEAFDLRAEIRSNVATAATAVLYQNGFRVAEQPLDLLPGGNEARFQNLRAAADTAAYEVQLNPAQDTRPENNRASVTVALGGKPRVLLIDPDESHSAALAQVWRDASIETEVRPPAGLPQELSELQRCDLLVLSDVPATSLSREQMELYRMWVQQFGGGFLMIGGENSFGAGGYFRTPIEQMLPVRTEHDDRQDTPTVALYVSLDRSGSMAAPVAGQTKIALADQGAALALDVLQSRDLFCLAAVDTKVDTVVPLSHPNSRPGLEQKIQSITAGGGGIYIYTALQEAYAVMRQATAKVKHVILFSDAADAEEKNAGDMADGARGSGSSADLVSAAFADKITTSVVGLGSERDQDVNFLRLLAERGNGRFYLTNDATTLPQIFTAETMKVAQSSLVEEPFNAVPAGRSAAIAGIDWKAAPPLLGYNATKPKPTADIALTAESGDPLLASWRYGLGEAAAFTSDAKERWAAEWLAWDGFGKFWTGVARSLIRQSGAGGNARVDAAELEDGKRLRVDLDALTPAGVYRDGLTVTVTALDSASGRTQTIHADQIAPGHYRAEVGLPTGKEPTMVSVSAPGLFERPYVFAHSKPFPREYLSSDTDEAELRKWALLGGGKFALTPADVFARPTNKGSVTLDLTNYFLALALILLPIDIFLRRRTWREPARASAAAPRDTIAA